MVNVKTYIPFRQQYGLFNSIKSPSAPCTVPDRNSFDFYYQRSFDGPDASRQAISTVNSNPLSDPALTGWPSGGSGGQSARRAGSPVILPLIFSALMLLCCLFLWGCPVDVIQDSGDYRNEVGELKIAGISRLLSPVFVMPDGSVPIVARGLHEDECTRFERFETVFSDIESGTEINAWSVRPVGHCPKDPVPWEAGIALYGLEAGFQGIFVGRENRDIIVLSGNPEDCAEELPLEIMDIILPPATHPGNSPLIGVKLLHPGPCHSEPVISHEIINGKISLSAHSKICGPVDDKRLCPDWDIPVTLSYKLDPFDEGERIISYGSKARAIRVVERDQCVFRPMQIESVSVPAFAMDNRKVVLSIRGILPSACSAVDDVSWNAVSEDLIEVNVSLRDCVGVCGADASGEKVEFDAVLENVFPGRWNLEVGGVRADRSMIVALPGVCAKENLPAENITTVLKTSGLYRDLSVLSARENEAVDVHVMGSLPDGCWTAPMLEGSIDGEGKNMIISLRTIAYRCDLGCENSPDGEPVLEQPALEDGMSDGEEDPIFAEPPDDADGGGPVISDFGGPRSFSAAWLVPAGLDPGEYRIMLDGDDYGLITVE